MVWIWMNCHSVIPLFRIFRLHLIDKADRFITRINICCMFCTFYFIDFSCCIFNCFRNSNKSIPFHRICSINIISGCRDFTILAITKLDGTCTIIYFTVCIVWSWLTQIFYHSPRSKMSICSDFYLYTFFHSSKLWIIYNFSVFVFSSRIYICISQISYLIRWTITLWCRFIPVFFFHSISICNLYCSTFYVCILYTFILSIFCPIFLRCCSILSAKVHLISNFKISYIIWLCMTIICTYLCPINSAIWVCTNLCI